jgi:hypothetical protein
LKKEEERAQQSFCVVAMTVGGWLVWHCPKTKLGPRHQRIARAKQAAPLPLRIAVAEPQKISAADCACGKLCFIFVLRPASLVRVLRHVMVANT